LGSSPLKLDHEVKTIQAALKRSRKRDNFLVEYQLAATPSELRRALLDFEPHVLHFSGHGAGEQGLLFVSDESAGAIYRSDSGEVRSHAVDTNEIRFVPAQPLANLLQLCDEHLECVVLNACYSDVQGNAIANSVPITIGMRDVVADNVAIKFSQGFYDAIGAGKSYEKAFEWGKVAIEFDLSNEEAAKILVLRKKEETLSADDSSGDYMQIAKTYLSNSLSPSLDNLLEQFLYPSNSKTSYFNCAMEKHEKGNNYGAIFDYSEAIRLNPNNSAAYNNRGNVKDDLGDKQGAIFDYDEAIRLNPDDALFYSNRGLAKYDLGDKEGAVDDYDEAIRLDPEYTDAYYNRGLAKSTLGDKEGAVADYTEVLQLDPEYTDAYYNRGLAKSTLGDKEGAVADYTEILRLDSNSSAAYNFRAWTQYLMGNIQEALTDINLSLEINPQSSEANHTHGAILFYGLSRPQEAITAFEDSIKFKFNSSESYCDLGIVMASIGSTQEAINNFTKAIVFDSSWAVRSLAEAYLNRGNTHQQIGNKQIAIDDFREAARLYQQQGKTSDYEDAQNRIKKLGG